MNQEPSSIKDPLSRAGSTLDSNMSNRDIPAVLVEQVIKQLGSFTAVKELSFTIGPGEIFGLLGPNGSGKTTTLNMISGLSDPTSGRILVFGMNPRQQAASVRRLLGVVPQETALYEELTAERNLHFHAELFGYRGAEKKRRVESMLELAQLTDRAKSRVSTFSGGMKRRLAIVRAMLHNPQLIYLDEPTLGVDVQSRNVIWEYILKMKNEGKSVLLTTNYLEEANALCDRIAILDHGQLLVTDTPTALKSRFGSSVLEVEVTTSPGGQMIETLSRISGVQGVEVEGLHLRISFADSSEGDAARLVPQIIQELNQGGLTLHQMNLREPSLDEVFLALTGKGVRD